MTVIGDVFPDAKVNVKCDEYANFIKIFTLQNNKTQEIFSCPQRDMFRKNKWPARPQMTQALLKLK